MKRDKDSLFVASAALPPREYVLLVSGTMNPPHAGHVRLGITAADGLCKMGHTVKAVCYVPVHDNYLCNKVMLKRKEKGTVSVVESIAFPITERCELLKELLARETSERAAICHILDYEHHATSLLAESPGYWAPKLPDGYLRTVPTAALIGSFAETSPLMQGGARLGVVFGVDNLAGMASWNDPGQLLARADLVFLARAMPRVEVPKDPSELLGALKHADIGAAVPIVHGEAELLGGALGSFTNEGASGDSALFMLPPLEGDDESLSSTRIREALAEMVATTAAASSVAASDSGDGDAGASAVTTLAQHGYDGASLDRLLGVVRQGEHVVNQMASAGRERGEWTSK